MGPAKTPSRQVISLAMIIIRLFHWAFRIKTLPTSNYNDMRPPTLGEAITGVSMT